MTNRYEPVFSTPEPSAKSTADAALTPRPPRALYLVPPPAKPSPYRQPPRGWQRVTSTAKDVAIWSFAVLVGLCPIA